MKRPMADRSNSFISSSADRTKGRRRDPQEEFATDSRGTLRVAHPKNLRRVPAVYLTSAEGTILAVLPFIGINNLRLLRVGHVFESRPAHQCLAIMRSIDFQRLQLL